MLLSCCYRPPKGVTENLTAYLASIFRGVQNEIKKSFIIGDFNLNCLNYNDEDIFTTKCLSLDLFFLLTSLERFAKIARQ